MGHFILLQDNLNREKTCKTDIGSSADLSKPFQEIEWAVMLKTNPNFKRAAALGGPVGGGEGQKICTNFAPTLGSNLSFPNCFDFTFQICGGSAASAAKEKADKEETKEGDK
jgi:hypothetical protein